MQEQNSLRDLIRGCSSDEITSAISELTDAEARVLLYDWTGIWARESQLPPSELSDLKNIWLILAGRGWGKTRTGAEYVRELVNQGYKRIALIAPTPADARDVMIEGESGILNIYPDNQRPIYEPSKRRLTFSNGAIATVYSGYKPDQLRGPQHDAFWADELAAWQYMEETWDMLMFGLRLGDPRGIITTTPRPLKLIKELKSADNVVLTTGSTYDNRDNLSKTFFNTILKKYEGTTLGEQELNARILEDNPNALWKMGNIEGTRLRDAYLGTFKRVVVAIDPNASDNENSDEIGIIVAGIDHNEEGYVLADLSMSGSPQEWTKKAVEAYYDYKADRIVAETNQGGNMIEALIRTVDKNVSYRGVHATKGKYVRAEPVSALYEQKRVHHVGNFAKLEDELCDWVPGGASPNRLDALVWALTDLMLEDSENRVRITNRRF